MALLLATTGFCALVYQTAWIRLFRLLFGATTHGAGPGSVRPTAACVLDGSSLGSPPAGPR